VANPLGRGGGGTSLPNLAANPKDAGIDAQQDRELLGGKTGIERRPDFGQPLDSAKNAKVKGFNGHLHPTSLGGKRRPTANNRYRRR